MDHISTWTKTILWIVKVWNSTTEFYGSCAFVWRWWTCERIRIIIMFHYIGSVNQEGYAHRTCSMFSTSLEILKGCCSQTLLHLPKIATVGDILWPSPTHLFCSLMMMMMKNLWYTHNHVQLANKTCYNFGKNAFQVFTFIVIKWHNRITECPFQC